MIVHEPASTEVPEAEDIPAVNPTAAEDIGPQDNVEDDEVLPQIEHNVVSSPVLTNSELISIGRPLTPIAQDDSWADHPQDSPRQEETLATPPTQVTTPVLEDDDFEAQPTPSPQASPAFRRLRKGPRPQVTLSSVPEGDERQSVSRQVFPEASPTVNNPESEPKAAEDIPAASADDQEEETREEEARVDTPPTNQVV